MPDNSGMFGGPVGTVAYDENLQNNLKGTASVIQSMASARYLNSEAAEKEERARQLGLMGQIMQSAGTAGPGGAGGPGVGNFSLSDRFDTLARTAANSGLVTQAETLAKTAAELRSKEATALSAKTTARVNQIKEVKERSQLMGQLFGGATDEASWNRANAMFTFQTGQPSPYTGVPFSPQLVQTLKAQSLEMREKLDLEEKRLSREATQDYREARLLQIDSQTDINRSRLRLEREKEERLAKTGGKGAVGAATTEEVREVKRQMELAGIDTKSLDSASLNSSAFAIASRAREMQKENPALGRAQAIQRAFTEAQEGGDLAVATTGGVDIPIIGTVGGKKQFKKKESPEGIVPDQSLVQAAGWTYEPAIYEYRVGPGGKLQRRKK